jgi:hypothetical protein
MDATRPRLARAALAVAAWAALPGAARADFAVRLGEPSGPPQTFTWDGTTTDADGNALIDVPAGGYGSFVYYGFRATSNLNVAGGAPVFVAVAPQPADILLIANATDFAASLTVAVSAAGFGPTAGDTLAGFADAFLLVGPPPVLAAVSAYAVPGGGLFDTAGGDAAGPGEFEVVPTGGAISPTAAFDNPAGPYSVTATLVLSMTGGSAVNLGSFGGGTSAGSPAPAVPEPSALVGAATGAAVIAVRAARRSVRLRTRAGP